MDRTLCVCKHSRVVRFSRPPEWRYMLIHTISMKLNFNAILLISQLNNIWSEPNYQSSVVWLMNWIAYYSSTRQFVDRHFVNSISSTTFSSTDNSSTRHFVNWHFVNSISSTTFCRQLFVDRQFVDKTFCRPVFCRQDILSTDISSTSHFLENKTFIYDVKCYLFFFIGICQRCSVCAHLLVTLCYQRILIRILYEVHFNQYFQNHRWNLSGFLTTGIVVPVPSMSKTRACARRCMENEYVTSMSLETIANRFNKKKINLRNHI